MTINWERVGDIRSLQYTCSYCGANIASNRGYEGKITGSLPNRSDSAYIIICHHCHQPTYIDQNGRNHPGASSGNPVNGISDQGVLALYEEARRASAASAHTASVLCCRKLLMNIAVSKGANTGSSFAQYVEYLSSKGFVPLGSEVWLNHIRTKGNEATHEIAVISKPDADELLTFTEMLLKLIYEFPDRMKSKTP